MVETKNGKVNPWSYKMEESKLKFLIDDNNKNKEIVHLAYWRQGFSLALFLVFVCKIRYAWIEVLNLWWWSEGLELWHLAFKVGCHCNSEERGGVNSI